MISGSAPSLESPAIRHPRRGCGLPVRRIGSLSVPAAAECEARVRRRMAELPSEALTHRPEILFATASRP